MYRFLITGTVLDNVVSYIQTFEKKRPTSEEISNFIKIKDINISNITLLERGDNSRDEIIEYVGKNEFQYKGVSYIGIKGFGCHDCAFEVTPCSNIGRPSCDGIIFKRKTT